MGTQYPLNSPIHHFGFQLKRIIYPDFVAELEDGSIFVLEYKGGHLDTADDARIKNDIGKQWAKDSNGKRKFLMAKKQDEAGRASLKSRLMR